MARVRGGLSLRAQLLLAAVLLVLVPGIVYGVIALGGSRTALADAGGRLLMQEARGAADRLAAALRAERARIETLAVQDVMREIRIADLDKRISGLLASARRNCALCADFVVRDRRGQVVASSNPALIGQDRAIGRVGTAAILGPLAAAAGAPLRLQLGVEVPDPDGGTLAIGDLIVWLDWERLMEIAQRVRENLKGAGLDTSVLVLAGDGTVIGGSLRPGDRWTRGQVLPEPVAESVTGYVDTNAGLLVGYAPMPPGLPAWTVRVTEPLAEAYAPARRTAIWLGLAQAAVLALALLLAVAAARRLTSPLTALASAAESVGRGERPIAAIPVRSGDEVGTLTEAFNRMASDLARVEHELVEAAKFSFVGQLAAGIAHEVRTPLGVMRSSAQLLAQSPELKNEESRELLQLLQDEVDRVDGVVSALLDLGRPRQVHAQPTPLGALLLRAAKFVEAQASQKRISIRLGRFKPDPVVSGDPELLYQVMLNLIVNAVQILPEGGEVVIGLDAAQAGRAGFEVRDNGPGVEPADCVRLFEPFFTRREGGTGLGLTFVQRVVREHRGEVLVDSEPGRGTSFRVLIPLAEEME